MKIINEKGKLFGIINIIDLALLLVIAALAVGALLYMNRSGGGPVAEIETKDYYVTLFCKENRPEVAEAIKVGDRLYFSNTFTNLEITEVRSEPAKINVPMPDGTLAAADHPILKDIFVTIRVIDDPVDPADPMIYYGATHATVGKNVTLKTTTVAFFEVPAAIEQAARAVIRQFPGAMQTEPWPASDHSWFYPHGIPTLAISQGGLLNLDFAHTPDDNMGWISPAKLEEAVNLTEKLIRLFA